MIPINGFLSDGLRFIFDNSTNTLLKVYSYTIGAGSYDDEVIKAITGSRYLSGLIFPIKNKYGSQEALLMEQGRLLTKDKVMYVTGSQNFSGNILIGIGSPNPNEYFTIIPDGHLEYSNAGSIIFSRFYLRHTIPGSLF